MNWKLKWNHDRWCFHQSLGFAEDERDEIEDVGRYVVQEESDAFVREIITLASEIRVPEHIFGGVGHKRFRCIQPELFPCDRISVARRTAVRNDLLRSYINVYFHCSLSNVWSSFITSFKNRRTYAIYAKVFTFPHSVSRLNIQLNYHPYGDLLLNTMIQTWITFYNINLKSSHY